MQVENYTGEFFYIEQVYDVWCGLCIDSPTHGEFVMAAGIPFSFYPLANFAKIESIILEISYKKKLCRFYMYKSQIIQASSKLYFHRILKQIYFFLV